MSRYQVKQGGRVGAICGENEAKEVEFFGYGVYEGRKPPPPGVKFMGIECSEVPGYEAVSIKLDSGKVVFGCECWWSSEEEVRKLLAGYAVEGKKIVEVDIESKRSQYAS